MSLLESVIKFTKSGFEITQPEYIRERLNTCYSCDKHSGGICMVCGCIASIKVRMATESCPIGKWLATDGTFKEQKPEEVIAPMDSGCGCRKR